MSIKATRREKAMIKERAKTLMFLVVYQPGYSEAGVRM
jgi:hypothetical protein